MLSVVRLTCELSISYFIMKYRYRFIRRGTN